MAHVKWTGEELFMLNGDLVFIIDPEPDNEDESVVLVSSYPSGEPSRACWDNMYSATPEQLKGII